MTAMHAYGTMTTAAQPPHRCGGRNPLSSKIIGGSAARRSQPSQRQKMIAVSTVSAATASQ